MRYGMMLFISSEVMFFVAFFWAFFDRALFPVGGVCHRKASIPLIRLTTPDQYHDPAIIWLYGNLGASCAVT